MRAFVLSLAVSLGFLVLSLHAIRRQHLRERQALLWIGVCAMLVFLSATLPLHILDHVAHFVGIAYPPDLILLIGILFLVALVFQLSIALARLSAKQTVLVQEIGLLTAQVPNEPAPGTSEQADVPPKPAPRTVGDR
jgi:hypothetical protein